MSKGQNSSTLLAKYQQNPWKCSFKLHEAKGKSFMLVGAAKPTTSGTCGAGATFRTVGKL